MLQVLCGVLSVPFFIKKPKIFQKDDGTITDVTYLMEDTDSDEDPDDGILLSSCNKTRRFFKGKHAKRTVTCAFKSRDPGMRKLLWIFVIIFGIIEFVNGLERVIDIVFIRDKYIFSQPDMQDYR